MKLKKGDKVKVMAGKDKGKEGVILQVFPDLNKVVVEGVNIMKKHLRSGKKEEKGQRIELAAPLSASNVALLDPANGKPTRVGFKFDGKEKKRYAKASGVVIAK